MSDSVHKEQHKKIEEQKKQANVILALNRKIADAELEALLTSIFGQIEKNDGSFVIKKEETEEELFSLQIGEDKGGNNVINIYISPNASVEDAKKLGLELLGPNSTLIFGAKSNPSNGLKGLIAAALEQGSTLKLKDGSSFQLSASEIEAYKQLSGSKQEEVCRLIAQGKISEALESLKKEQPILTRLIANDNSFMDFPAPKEHLLKGDESRTTLKSH